MKLPELQLLAKEHNIKGCSYRNKPDLIALLGEKGLLSNEFVEKENRYQEEREEKKGRKAESGGVVDEKHERLKSVRTNPRIIEILDRETGEVVVYPSKYKAALVVGQSAGIMSLYNGNVWKNRYEIKALDKIIDSGSSSERVITNEL